MLEDLYLETEDLMNKTLAHLKHELSGLRTGRASTGIFENIKVDYYGTPTPLNQIANISIPDARMVVIQPWEKKMLNVIEKAILTSDLGLNPNNDGQLIRVPIPYMTEERRKDMVKLISKMTEEARIAVRNIRRDANEKIKKAEKASELSKDNAADGLEAIQEMTNSHIKKLDLLFELKEKEILES
ncbi:MAG TPA: ribosome recycling factor [Candidatus Marinimicrobia bacterium]|nr:ribosome recycling factor [Candidatus Neomarinimicrobiota bacterium]